MSSEAYRFSATLRGHEGDVRSVCAVKDTLISASRDCTARRWIRKDGCEFSMAEQYIGHSGFVSVVTVSPPTREYPEGLIFTGSNDATILAFIPSTSQPIYKLQGHTHNVCALVCDDSGGLVSGAWDSTARFWIDGKEILCLKGHNAAVWAVAILPGTPGSGPQIVTGSADKSIRMWSVKDGHEIRNISNAHTDCVRGLALLPSSHQFLSCSNDASVRRWNAEGTLLAEYYAHSNFVYSVAVLPNETEFISCGEDRTVRVWNTRSTECVQTITLPAQSIWSCAALANGDIVVGCSDFTVRIFSRCSALQANAALQEAFHNEVASSRIPSQLGNIEVDKLPGVEALQEAGKKEGQVVMVREKNLVSCYQWIMASREWMKVGEVVGSQDQAAQKKKLDGKEYDFVFEVDINESGSALKIGCNRGDDPWHVAQAFIHQHDLSQLFLDQIAKFLISQTGDALLGKSNSTGMSSVSFNDPFTGGSRYAPEQEASISPRGIQHQPTASTHNPYFPKRDFIHFKDVNVNGVIKKLQEVSTSLSTASPAGDVSYLVNGLITSVKSGSVNEDFVTKIMSLLDVWPQAEMLPLLDLLRWSLLAPSCKRIFLSSYSSVERILPYGLRECPPTHQMLVVRALANCFHDTKLEEGFTPTWKQMLHWLNFIHQQHLYPNATTNLQIAVATLLLNIAVKLHLFWTTRQAFSETLEEHKIGEILLDVIISFLEFHESMDAEAAFRVTVACGTLLFEQERLTTKAITSGTLRSALLTCTQRIESQKLVDAALLLLSIF